MVEFCPVCNRRFSVARFNTDFEHLCNSGDPAIDQEDVLIIGKWEDFTGSDTNVFPTVSTRGGIENAFWGTLADIVGKQKGEINLSERGRTKTMFRQRQKFHFVDLKEKK